MAVTFRSPPQKPIAPTIKIGWWSVGLFDSYALKQMIVPFLFGVVAFTGVGSTIESLFKILRWVGDGLPLLVGLQLYLLSMPKIIVLTFPMSVLLAALIVYNRMSADSELVALRSCGVSPLRLIVPAVVMSLLVTGLTFAFNEVIVPGTSRQVEEMTAQVLGAHVNIRNNNILYQELGSSDTLNTDSDSTEDENRKLQRLFFARRFDGETMSGITLLDFTSEERTIVIAQKGVWLSDDEVWEFTNGTTYVINDDGSYRTVDPFQQQLVELPRTPIDASLSQDTESMNIAEMRDYIRLQEQAGQRKKVRGLRMDLQLKYAIPFACLTFGLIGAPLGMRLQRTNGALGFSLSILVIFLYYALLSIAQGLGQSDAVSPFIAAWIPNVVGWTAAGWLLWKIAH